MTSNRCLSLLLFALFVPALVQAGEGALQFRDAWIREAPPASPVMAGYVAIDNAGKREVLIDNIESSAFGGAEIHEMRDSNGIARMRPLDTLELQPGQHVDLAPGGLHLMLFRPVAPLKAGQRATIEFLYRDGTRQAVEFEVRAAE